MTPMMRYCLLMMPTYYKHGRNLENLFHSVDKIEERVDSYCSANKVKINRKNTSQLLITSLTNIQKDSSVELLDIHTDDSLIWRSYTEYICEKFNRTHSY